MIKKYDIKKIKKEGYTKLHSLNDLKDLLMSLKYYNEASERAKALKKLEIV